MTCRKMKYSKENNILTVYYARNGFAEALKKVREQYGRGSQAPRVILLPISCKNNGVFRQFSGDSEQSGLMGESK